MTVSPHEQTAPLIMSAVVAMAANQVIGDGAGLIWHLPDDLKRVKALTMGCPLIMGRKTWDSIGRPLPGRGSIVLTRDQHWHSEGAITVHDFNAALVAATPDEERAVATRRRWVRQLLTLLDAVVALDAGATPRARADARDAVGRDV